ncbi:5-formyltetrahydrofolate cyclo-ligase [Caloramator proteoclasticus]|uniref:5-formyltetrahydrofolate cyclo-ligase n=1 Tax=Caloramator proteoclasticus DSM 10124 TaxID=1121262 RepID=A0A1M4UCC8_9CLOT|nr:5-formyltetrahydrofolate cyclo-ligase [Caloramator proteoclasticus]SHE54268.1 5-formyltetrahydrofolate cyclo-ligase [Caloramator proteoclasticus DSM 10124]
MKNILRKKYINIRNELSKEEVIKRSIVITKHIINWDKFLNSNSIMIYSAFRNEVETSFLAEEILKEGKVLIYPKTIKSQFKLIPCIVNKIDELTKGEYGILEPKQFEVIDKKQIDLIFIPGVAFDKNGYRLGYGAGYYDRFLEDFKGIKVGICYDFQIVDDVYKDEHDIKMDYLICEEGILKL